MNIIENIKDNIIKKVANLVIIFSSIAIVQACTFFLHEEELPDILKNENRFTNKSH